MKRSKFNEFVERIEKQQQSNNKNLNTQRNESNRN